LLDGWCYYNCHALFGRSWAPVSELFTELLPAARSVKILLTYFFYDYSLAIGNNRTGFQSPREAQEKVFSITLPIYLPSTFPLFKEHGSPVQGFIKFLWVSALFPNQLLHYLCIFPSLGALDRSIDWLIDCWLDCDCLSPKTRAEIALSPA